MGDVVNLRTARKQRKRAGKDAQAEENRIRFGRTGAEKRLVKLEQERARKAHEANRREPDGRDEP